MTPTPRDTLHQEGTARLYRFRRPEGASPRDSVRGVSRPAEAGPPVLLVPSLINRWYILDLRPGASLVEALTRAGFDTYCLDWGEPEDEDRYLGWEDVLARLSRAARAVRRRSGAERLTLLGYCMGATVAGIQAALEPEGLAAFINLLGPFDFRHAGLLGAMADPRWFDAEAVAEAGNVSPLQMQSAFVLLRPTAQIGKWVSFAERAPDPEAREAFFSLEEWAADNIPFPAAAYRTYIRELYQQNLLVQGRHRVGGKRVDLSRIRCPVLTVVAERDAICPPQAAEALNEALGRPDAEVLRVSGGHVGAVVGAKASRTLYPAIISWLERHASGGGQAAWVD
ncbi:MAG: alpha/beta fold hydrolase [Myxococcales bacterium]|nr:alpha/beta fold hydrolase [Myxococcales bacterium]